MGSFLDPKIGVVSQAAFLVLPGVVQRVDRWHKAFEWLKEAEAASPVHAFIVQKAQRLVSKASTQQRERRERGHVPNLRKKATEFYRDGRWKAILRMIRDASGEEIVLRPSFDQHQNILRGLHVEVVEEKRWQILNATPTLEERDQIHITKEMV
mmetsp:Transcript_21534/g.23461  ORF Transcript_21534/g.23461 Transcript_21534/m.23461 type:complete len:154 (+) Transcript_21534:604-1065(+)